MQSVNPGNDEKCVAIAMKKATTTHLFCSNHGDDGDALFPHHLPEVLTRVRQGTLRGDVAPLPSASGHLESRETDQ